MSKLYNLSDLVTSIQEGKRSEAQSVIIHFIENRVDLKKDWLKVAALALRIGELNLARKAANMFSQSTVKNVEMDVQYAGIYAELGDLTQALKIITPYLEQKSSLPSVYHLAGTIKAQLGELQEARLYLLQALTSAPHLGITWFTLASIVDFTQHPGLLEKLEFVYQQIPFSDSVNQQHIMYALAKAYADRAVYDKAWQLYNLGAKTIKPSRQYSQDADKYQVEQILSKFTKTAQLALPCSRSTYSSAIALLGLPRSGTTLLGQMLSNHSKVKGSGEFNAVGAACMHLQGENFTNFPSFIANHGHPVGALDHIANIYRDVAEQRFEGDGYIIDKSLNLNRYFGIFAQALPHAKAIYIRRNDADTAWSCFKSSFRSQAGWSWSAADISLYMKNERRLLKHWQGLYADRILEISYEDLVTQSEKVLAKVCHHLGLDYEPEMLLFYKNKAPVFTSSVGQVHQPIHVNSIGLSGQYPDFVSQLL